MFYKLYEKLKKNIIENHNYILFIILFILLINLKFPFVINCPGGVISLKDRIGINDKENKYDFYATYVSVREANVISIIASLFIDNWDVEKIDNHTGVDDISFTDNVKIDKLLLNEGNNVSKIVALEKNNIDYKKTDNRLIVIYSPSKFNNGLKINDQIIKCNNEDVNTYEDLDKCISLDKDHKIEIKIKRGKKIITKDIKLQLYQGKYIIGVNLIEDFKVSTDKKINIKTSKNESGPSGGLMNTLSLYYYLSDKKIKDVKIAGTGTIDVDGSVGEIDGIKYKLLGVSKNKIRYFLCPFNNYFEALDVVDEYNLDIKIVPVNTIDDAIKFIDKLS